VGEDKDVPRLPDGDPAPESGDLPEPALATLGDGRFGVYLHVPYCSVRCGYCDFNTYTLGELGPGASMTTFADQALAELDLAARVLGDQARPVDTVFVGGGTPTLLPAADLVRCVDGIRTRFGLSPDAEVTTEANPDSVNAEDLAELAAGGFTRVSIGMQSVVPHVLRTLERTHDPARVATAVAAAKAAGLATSVDLIYGTPGREPRRLARQPRRRRRPGARPRLGLRADRRGRHEARGAGASGSGRDARR
jgi:coproporphyrinogen III oxidase-like Fe-S oxidoreductase